MTLIFLQFAKKGGVMYARFPKTTTCFFFFLGLFVLTSMASASTSWHGQKTADDPLASRSAHLWIAQTDAPADCAALVSQAEQVIHDAEAAAEKAYKAAEEAKMAGEALDRAKAGGEATDKIRRAAKAALEAAEAAEKAADEAETAAAAARHMTQEAERLGCLEIASTSALAADNAETAAQEARTIGQLNRERLEYFRPDFMDTETSEQDWYQETGREKETSPMQ